MELLLIRHGLPYKVAHDPAGADPALDDIGEEQARRLAAFLAEKPFGAIDLVVSSTMRRAAQTAAPAAEALGLPVEPEPRIIEIDAGLPSYGTHFEGYATPREMWSDLNRGRMGEYTVDLEAFTERAVAGLDAVVARPGDRAAVSCHGGVVNAYLSTALQTPRMFLVDVFYTSITRIRVDTDGFRQVLSVNETPHLR